MSMSMSEDRTAEFLAIASTLSNNPTAAESFHDDHRIKSSYNQSSLPNNNSTSQKSNDDNNSSNNNHNNMSTLKREAYAELRTFHITAASISRDISTTSTLLSELTQLVRRRGLFMDDTDRVNTLVLQIKTNIENLNGRLEEAQAVIKKQKRRLGNASQAGQEASNLVGQLKDEFVKATSGFKSILQVRSETMKEQKDRKKNVFGGNSATGGVAGNEESVGLLALGSKPPVYHHSNSSGVGVSGPGGSMLPMLDLTSALMSEQQRMSAGESTSSSSQLPRPRGLDEFSPNNGLRHRNSSDDHLPANNYILTPLEIQQSEESNPMVQQSLQLIPDHNYLLERADAMSAVESNIVELGTIFNKLAVMVSEHREMVQRVEDNVEDTNDTINLSLMTLTDSLRNLQTNKMLAMKIFGVIVLFIIFFVAFFA